ncbi:hypothetical protein Taro_003426 [Colocasia esculenta]|uniref:Uncharacterized protein n=1 Tax=Colocasia esculenta TaxID=4460 RepID=A0A843TNY5_COLES|nr:hypothetical protein [Colocasia esculenta]
MGLQLCVCRCGVGWSPQLFDFFLVEQQLDLSSVTARLRVRPIGVEVSVVSVLLWVAPTEPVTC